MRPGAFQEHAVASVSTHQARAHSTYEPCSLRIGDPVASLPLLNYVLLKYSKHVAQAINKAGFEVGHAVYVHLFCSSLIRA